MPPTLEQLDRLVAAYRRRPSEDTGAALIRCYFEHPKWLFLGVGDATPPVPWWGPVDRWNAVAVFTDERLAAWFAEERSAKWLGKMVITIEASPTEAARRVEKAAESGVDAVEFNPGVHGIVLPLDMFREACRQFLGDIPEPQSRAGEATGALALRNRVIARNAHRGEGVTLTLEEFFDGNWQDQSIAPNLSRKHPGIGVFRDVLFRVRGEPGVRDVRVEVHEWPNPETPLDDDIWIAAERVFVVGEIPVERLRELTASLKPDSVALLPPEDVPEDTAGAAPVVCLWWD